MSQYQTFHITVEQVAQLLQRDRTTHELLRFAKLRSRIFERPFWGLRGNVDASCVRRLKKRGRLPVVINEHLVAVTAGELQAEISSILRFVKVVRHFDAIFEVEGLVFPPTSMYR